MEEYLDRGALKNPKVSSGAGDLVHATGPDDTDNGVVGCELLILLGRIAKGVQPVADQVFQTPYTRAHITHIYTDNVIRTVGKALKVLLEVGVGTLAAPADRDSEVLGGDAALRVLVRCRPVWFQPDDKEPDAVRTPAVFLRINLGL